MREHCFNWRGIALFVGIISLLQQNISFAWEAHNLFTEQALVGFQKTDSSLFEALQTTKVQIHPIETFLEKAFGSKCILTQAKDTVFGGLGKDYKVLYVDGVFSQFKLDIENGVSRIEVNPIRPIQLNDQSYTTPAQILATYSDEPDWLMDDDVELLKGKGPTKDLEGSGTRILRHFWYEGETHYGVDFGKDQEMDRRFELYYQLSLIAFSVGENYWGYRFLANAIHYIQDMAQPFHVKAVMSESMINVSSVVYAAAETAKLKATSSIGGFFGIGNKSDQVCTTSKSPLDKALIENGFVLSAYHSVYEGFLRGLLLNNPNVTTRYLTGFSGSIDQSLSEVQWDNNPSTGLFDFRKIIQSAQKSIIKFAPEVSTSMIDYFGTGFVENPSLAHQEIIAMGTDQAVGFARASSLKLSLSDPYWLIGNGSQDRLLKVSLDLLTRTGVWTRKIIQSVLSGPSDSVVALVEKRKSEIAGYCK